MREKTIILLTSVLAVAQLTACGHNNNNTYDSYGSTGGLQASIESTNSGVSGWSDSASAYSWDTDGYSSANIQSDYADYSYKFSTNGELNKNKTKEDIMNYYDELQTLVQNNGGYISNVYNSYSENVIDPEEEYYSDTEIAYKSYGTLSFTIQVDNEHIDEIVESLNTFSKEFGLQVTDYTQNITNYEIYSISDETKDYNEEITQEELDKRLKYADLKVNIRYYRSRSSISAFGLRMKYIAGIILRVLITVICIAVLIGIFATIIVLWLNALKVQQLKDEYKRRVKHPEYYPAKKIELVNTKVELVASNEAIKEIENKTSVNKEDTDAKEETK